MHIYQRRRRPLPSNSALWLGAQPLAVSIYLYMMRDVDVFAFFVRAQIELCAVRWDALFARSTALNRRPTPDTTFPRRRGETDQVYSHSNFQLNGNLFKLRVRWYTISWIGNTRAVFIYLYSLHWVSFNWIDRHMQPAERGCTLVAYPDLKCVKSEQKSRFFEIK